jgi:hypothetical protein
MTAVTDVALHLQTLERALLDPDVRADRARVAALIADDFIEIGASGAVFGKQTVLQALPEERGVAFEAGDMHACLVTGDVARIHYIVTRTAGDDVRRSLRSSWWRRDPDGAWRMVFHQGTPDTGIGSF